MTKKIKIADIEIYLTRKKIKHLYLKVSAPYGRAKLSAPLKTPDEDIYNFLLEKKDWIKIKQSKMMKKELNFKEWTREEIELGKKYLEVKVPFYIKKWEPIMQVKVDSWYSRLMKTRWGSCNINKNRICINLSLSNVKEELLEYVIVHEMIHLKEQYHNKRFYSYLNLYLPEWKKYKKILSER